MYEMGVEANSITRRNRVFQNSPDSGAARDRARLSKMEADIANSSLFTQIDPEAIERHLRRHDLTPEKKLMLAVLTDAIKTIRNPTRRIYGEYVGKNNSSKKRRLLDQETRRWFDSLEDEWPFSFRHVCHVLGLDPDYVRRGVLKGKGKIRKGEAAKAET